MMRISGSYHSAYPFPLFLLFSVWSVYSARSNDGYSVVNKNMRVVKSEHCIPPPAARGGRRYVRKDSGYDTRCVKVAAFSRESYSLKVTISFDCCIISALPQTHGLATCPSSLAPYVGCRRVVFLPKRRHSVSCRRHVVDMFQSCRRHDQMSCWPGCPKRHDMSAVPDMSVKCLVL